MSTTTQVAMMTLLVGLAFGAGGYHLYQTEGLRCQLADRVTFVADEGCEPSGTVRGARAVNDGLQAQTIPEQGIALRLRPTDELIRIKTDETTVIGARVFDSFSGEASSAPHVDLIWQPQAELADLPEATTIDAYRQQVGEGFTIDKTIELTIGDHRAIKQLYSATVQVPGPFGSTQSRPAPNQLRYVIDRGEGKLLLIHGSIATQKLLDLVATKLTFGSTQSLPTNNDSGAATNATDDILQGASELIDQTFPSQGSQQLNVSESSIELKLE